MDSLVEEYCIHWHPIHKDRAARPGPEMPNSDWFITETSLKEQNATYIMHNTNPFMDLTDQTKWR